MSTVHTSADKPVVAADGYFYLRNSDGTEKKLSFMSLMIELGLSSLESNRNAFTTQFERAQEKVQCMQELNDLTQQANNIKSKYKEGAKSDAMANGGDLLVKLAEFNRKYPNQKVAFTLGDIAIPILNPAVTNFSEAYNYYNDEYMKLDNLTKGPNKRNLTDAEKAKKADMEKKRDAIGPGGTKILEKFQKVSDADTWGSNDCKNFREAWGYVEEWAKATKTSEQYATFLKNTVTGHYLSNQGVQNILSNMQTAQSTLSSENEQQSMRTNQAMNRSSGFLQQLQNMMQTAKEALQAASKAGGV